jgi:retron-type reverse transcriptase
MVEIDITAYFDSIVREQLMELIEKRVRDRSVLRMIRKWIQVGVIEEGRLLVSETGTGRRMRGPVAVILRFSIQPQRSGHFHGRRG